MSTSLTTQSTAAPGSEARDDPAGQISPPPNSLPAPAREGAHLASEATCAGVSGNAVQPSPLIGIGMLCLAVFLFSIQDVIIKSLSGGYPVGEVLIIRCLVAMPIFLILVHRTGGLQTLAASQMGLVLMRAVLLLLAYLLYYMALPALPLADATALYFVTPLVVVAMAGVLLGEPLGGWRWFAVAVGFAGAIIALDPGSGLLEWASLLALGAAFAYAGSQIMARAMRASHSAAVLSFYQNLVLITAAALLGLNAQLFAPQWTHPSLAFLTRPFVWPAWPDLALMMACGPIAAVGSTLLTEAYRRAPANLVSVFEYTALLWLTVWGFLIWGDVPKIATATGAGLIVAAGLIALLAPAGRQKR